MSSGIYVPNSFVLLIPKMERQSCSHAGSMPKGKIQLDCPGAPLSMCCAYSASLGGVRFFAG